MIKRQLANGQTVTARQNGGIRKRCACPRSHWVRCAHPWHGNFSWRGEEHRTSLHKWAKKSADYVMLQGEAKSLFRQWTASIEGGAETPAVKARAGVTFDAIATLYLAEYVHQPDRRKKAAAEMARQVEVLRTAFGDELAASITKPMIETFRQGRRHDLEANKAAVTELAALRAEGATVPDDLVARATRAAISTKDGRVATNRLLTRLRHLFAWAIAEKGVLEASPFSKGGVSVIKVDRKAENGRTRRLEGDEEARLLTAAGAHLHACIVAALDTGMRQSEILGLQWQHVRSSLGVIELPAHVTKTGMPRTVILTPNLTATLEMRAAVQRATAELDADADLPGEWHPFGNELGERIQGIRTAWRLTCRRAGIVGLHFHDLRREAGSALLEAPGVSLTDVRDFLGHASVSQTNTYLSSSVRRLRDAVTKRDAARTNLAHPVQPTEQAETTATVTH